MAAARLDHVAGAMKVGGSVLALAVLITGLFSFHVSRAEVDTRPAEDEARHVTVFGVQAKPGSATVDSNLTSIRSQLDKLLPRHGFKLLDAQSNRMIAGDVLRCKLSSGYSVAVTLVQAADENGKMQLRCELFHENDRDFSTLVKAPLHQLFFCERQLSDGSKLLIGIGAR